MSGPVSFPPVEFHTCDEVQSYVEDVMHWHEEILEREGFRGQRDMIAEGVISSVVVSTFMSHFEYTPADKFHDFFEQMAFFADHLSADHPFDDGNKRTTVKQVIAYMHACGIGIRLNDSDDPEKNELYRLITRLVTKEMTYKDVADLLRWRSYDLLSGRVRPIGLNDWTDTERPRCGGAK